MLGAELWRSLGNLLQLLIIWVPRPWAKMTCSSVVDHRPEDIHPFSMHHSRSQPDSNRAASLSEISVPEPTDRHDIFPLICFRFPTSLPLLFFLFGPCVSHRVVFPKDDVFCLVRPTAQISPSSHICCVRFWDSKYVHCSVCSSSQFIQSTIP